MGDTDGGRPKNPEKTPPASAHSKANKDRAGATGKTARSARSIKSLPRGPAPKPKAKAPKPPGRQINHYTPDMVDQVWFYIENFHKKPWLQVLPSIEGVAELLGVSRQTITNWENHPDRGAFAAAVDQVRVKQGLILINEGLRGKLSSVIARLMLHKHGYAMVVEESGPDGGPIKHVIEANATPEDARRTYEQMLKGTPTITKAKK